MMFEERVPERILPEPSAWQGLENILEDLLDQYEVERTIALEFGVEYGYSTVALSNFFDLVVGVDTFEGDEHCGHKETYQRAKKNCGIYKNIDLVKSSYQEFIEKDDNQYDFIHIDIVHNFHDTYNCGDWAVQHAPVVIFHDTESFPEVKRAVKELAKKNKLQFDNYPLHYGLGILHRI